MSKEVSILSLGLKTGRDGESGDKGESNLGAEKKIAQAKPKDGTTQSP